MALFVIGDLHLSLTAGKPMDIFGPEWAGHTEKLVEGFRCIGPDDTVVLLGDLSWGSGLRDAEADFRFIDAFPGRKLLVKGNHDHWWATVSKMRRQFQEYGLNLTDFLHNTAYRVEDMIVCGTRGWFYEEDRATNHDEKVFLRELGRLQASLDAGEALRRESDAELICCLHYPPLYEGYRCDEIVDMMTRYGVKRCYYGHLHGAGRNKAIEGEYRGIGYTLVSADHINFIPLRVDPNQKQK